MNNVVTEFELRLREGPLGVKIDFDAPGVRTGAAAYTQLVEVIDDFISGFGPMPNASGNTRVPAKVIGHITEGGGVAIRVTRIDANSPVPPVDLFAGYFNEVGQYFKKLRADLNG